MKVSFPNMGNSCLISELIMRDMKVVGLPFLEITMDDIQERRE